MHIGNNKWIIIDSCLNPVTKEPAAIYYLRQLGLEPDKCVSHIIATHWHSDHIRGLSKTLELCKSADFYCSDALRCDEFLKIIKSYSNYSMMERSGAEEFDNILNILRDRKEVPNFALSNRVLHEESIVTQNNNYNISMKSLSPSDKSVYLSKIELKKLLPEEKKTKLRIPSQSPNQTAVVISIQINNDTLLFGADLENTSDPDTGWDIIIRKNFINDHKACFFKIPHHGSKSSYNKNIWDQMLIQEPIAVLTPFINGSNNLPTQDDIKKILKHSSQIFSTSKMTKIKKTKRVSMVERTIKETVKTIYEINSNFGQVRYRKGILQSENTTYVECFGNACDINEMCN